MIWHATLWSIWKARNNALFASGNFNPRLIVEDIKVVFSSFESGAVFILRMVLGPRSLSTPVVYRIFVLCVWLFSLALAGGLFGFLLVWAHVPCQGVALHRFGVGVTLFVVFFLLLVPLFVL
jgi:hypothetical protein